MTVRGPTCPPPLAPFLCMHCFGFRGPMASSFARCVDGDVTSCEASARHPPVIYVQFASGGHIEASNELWPVLRLTRTHGNAIVLLTARTVVVPSDVANCLADRGDVDSLANTSLTKALRAVYAAGARAAAQYLGNTREPKERYNLERFFVMHEYMRRRRVPAAMLMDSDAALLSSASEAQRWMRARPLPCDSAIMGANPQLPMTHAPTWRMWAGTSLLSLRVLHDFLRFAIRVYHPATMSRIAAASKAKTVPVFERYWQDMMSWYLFAAVADSAIGERVGLQEFESSTSPRLDLPRLTNGVADGVTNGTRGRWHLCDLESFGFNNNHNAFMDGARTDQHTSAADVLLRPGPFSLYTSELRADTARRFFWRGERVRSMHFWLQKSTVLEVVSPRTYLRSATCTLPPFANSTWTKAWAKLGYLLGISRRSRRARSRI